MNYELAKELKEAGFPQYENQVMSAEDVTPLVAYHRKDHRTFDLSLMGYQRTEPDYYTQGKFRPSCVFARSFLNSEEGKMDTFYFPNLSELIESCGKEHDAPNRNTEEQKPVHHLFRLGWGDGWYATYEFYDSMMENQYGQPIIEYGDTPEEAVARLWLALNPQKK